MTLTFESRDRFECWRRPSWIELKDGQLSYEFGQPIKLVNQRPGLLPEFIALADVTAAEFPTKVKAFARRWGVLELCRHGWPISHPNFADARRPDGSYDYCSESDPASSSEPLALWRFWSRQAQALLRATAATRQKGAGRPEDWIVLIPALPAQIMEIEQEYTRVSAPAIREIENALKEPSWVSMQAATSAFQEFNRHPVPRLRRVIAANELLADAPLPLSGGDCWKRIALVVNHWLTLGHPQPFCSAQGGQLKRVMAAGAERDHGWLFAALAAELLRVIPEPWGVFLCTSCGAVIIPERRPPRGRRYCDKCGIRAAWRDAQRRRRTIRKGSAS
jgi:hypothetical protein